MVHANCRAAAVYRDAASDQPHVPAQADPDIGAVIERVRRAIADERDDDGREATSGDAPCPGAAETS